MNRRRYLATLGTTGVVATAGCTALSGSETLSEPSVQADSGGRKSLQFESDGEAVGHLGVTGTVSDGVVDLRTEVWHRSGTTVESIRLRVWMPEATDTPADVAVRSPVEGDSSLPPVLSLYTPDRGRGTVVEVTDLDDLADETISTLGLLVRPSPSATELAVDATIELAGGGLTGTDYTLDGRLDLAFPELAGE